MSRRVIDLSQPLSRESQLHPFFPPTQILRHIQHTDAAAGDPSFSAEIIITSNHAATHVDAFGHYQPGGASLQEMSLDTFCGQAVCADIREYPGGHDVSAEEVANARHPGWLLRHLGGGRALDGGLWGEDLRRRDDQPRSRLPDRSLPDAPRL